MEARARPDEACSDCKSLKGGTRSLPGPHEYLVQSGRSESNSAVVSYRCLVCKSEMTCEPDGRLGRWK